MVVRRFVLGAPAAGKRIDQVVRTYFPETPRRVVRLWFAARQVQLDARTARKSDLAMPDQVLTVETTTPSEPSPVLEALNIIYETETVIVVNKPPGQPSAALLAGTRNSVAEQLLERYPQMATFGYSALDAGLVHRLDSGTSGALLAAKTAPAFQELTTELKAGRIRKSYLAWSHARPRLPHGTIESPLIPDPHNRRRMLVTSADQHNARFGRTDYELVASSSAVSLLRAHAPRATRHQVRAHLASLGCPLLGDPLYGGLEIAELSRHALHAERVEYAGSLHVDAFDCVVPPPPDLARLLSQATPPADAPC